MDAAQAIPDEAYREQWSRAFLTAIGNTSPSAFTLAFVLSWGLFETGSIATGASNNILNTTEGGPGVIGIFNSIGVKEYDSLEHGVAANAACLIGGPNYYYPALLKALQTNDDAALRNPPQAIQAELGIWGTGHAFQIAAMAAEIVGPIIPPLPESMLQAGWRDDSATLWGPNHIPVTGLFREHVLSSEWDPGDWPLTPSMHLDQLETSNTSLGPGVQQIFTKSVWQIPDSDGKLVAMFCGKEILALRNKLAQLYTAYQQAQQQIIALTTGKDLSR